MEFGKGVGSLAGSSIEEDATGLFVGRSVSSATKMIVNDDCGVGLKFSSEDNEMAPTHTPDA